MATDSRRRRQLIADVAIPIVVALFLVSLVESTVGLSVPVTVLGMLAGAVQGAALWWRRSHPELVMAIALVGGTVIQLVAPKAVFPYAGLIALASLAAVRAPRVSVPALAALLGVTALDYLTAPRDDATFAMLVAVVPWALGEAARNRRAAIVEASRRAVSEEQGRIARELHDVLAHSVSVIVVQAAAADEVFDERPDQARTSLRSIETVGREALGELRRVLGTVHALGEDRRSDGPRLGRLGELAEPLRSAGLEVELRREGIPSSVPVPTDVDLAAYRIVQEALTNTLRHARATRARVTIRDVPGAVELEVCDNGSGQVAEEQPAGRGISGMYERATMLGGTLEAGAGPDGGFRVYARLPVEVVR
jgi:signal transduction histidine kinase